MWITCELFVNKLQSADISLGNEIARSPQYFEVRGIEIVENM